MWTSTHSWLKYSQNGIKHLYFKPDPKSLVYKLVYAHLNSFSSTKNIFLNISYIFRYSDF